VRAARRQHLGQQLAVADLVRVQPHRVLGVPLRLVEAAERQQGASAQLVSGIVAGSLGQQAVGQAQHLGVVPAIQRLLHRSHRRPGPCHAPASMVSSP
jgi:hypothetical protein